MQAKQSTRRGVVICGSYGMENAGDEAVLAAITAELRRTEREIPITVMTRRPVAAARQYGVKGVHPLRVLRWMWAMRRAKLFLSGGGTLLQDVTSRRSLSFYLLTIRLAKKLGCAVQLYGCGVGPLLREGSRTRTAEVLDACADVITLRDADSAALLTQLGVTKPQILVAADPVISLPSAQGERERAAGLVLRDWPGFRERMPAFAAGARYLWERYRREPVLFCFAPEDRTPARALCGMIEAMGVPVSVSVDNRRIGRMSLVLSMRLHGLVFALRDGAQAAGVSYDPKVDAFCRDAGFPCLALGSVTEESLCTLIDEAAHLDGESLSAAARRLRERERANGRAASALLALSTPDEMSGSE